MGGEVLGRALDSDSARLQFNFALRFFRFLSVFETLFFSAM